MRRSYLLSCALLAIVMPALAQSRSSPTVARKARAKANPPVVFPQTQSDLIYDPAARIGRLPNGMTYVIYKNRTPPGAASVWLRIGAGSMMEQDNQRGLAHFIEHMAFNGSKNVPEGEMVKLLERDGLAFGADTNAQTSNLETLYMLNLPKVSDRVVDDALFLLRETAGNIRFDPAAIDRERGVILGEERARGGITTRAYEAQLKQLFPGQKYSERLPIGKVNIIKTAQRPAFIQFYNDFYRPEYATLIVAGDIDPARIEGDIQRRFSDWHVGPPSPGALTDFGTLVQQPEPSARMFAADGLANVMTVSWAFAPRHVVHTKAKDYNDFLFLFAKDILNQRFARAATSSGTAFLAARFARDEVEHTAQVYALNIRPKDGQDRTAFAQAMAILREYRANGPTRAELDTVLAGYEGYFKTSTAAARTRNTQAIAEAITNAVRSEGVFQSPAQDLAEFIGMKPSFTPAAIAATMKAVRLDTPPTLWREGTEVGAFDETAMLSAYREAMDAPVRAANASPGVSWPYTHFGTPSAIVSRQTLSDLGATRIVFANGVRLTVKQTDFQDDAVLVRVKLGNGLLGIGRDQAVTLYAASQIGLEGGLGKISSEDISAALPGKSYTVNFGIGATATTLNGATSTTDFALQMQLLAAFVSDPAFRPEVLDRYKATLATTYRTMKASPSGVQALEANGAAYDGDPRFSVPSPAALSALTQKSLADLVKRQLGSGPIDVTIVGDVTIDEAVRQVGATLGALPPRAPAISVPGADRLHFPTTDLRRIYMHEGRADQNLSMILWPTTDFYADTRRGIGLQLLAAVMTLRELDEIREKQGATYSTVARSAASTDFAGFGYLETYASVRPEMDEFFYRTVSKIATDLKARPITADELIRARLPMIDHFLSQQNTNDYWISVLSAADDPRKIAAAQTRGHDLMAVTPRDIQALARTYLDMTRALRIQVKPRAGATAD